MAVDRYNVGKIAERIVMDELDSHGCRTNDLNDDRLSAIALTTAVT